jgi:hypothetical protein
MGLLGCDTDPGIEHHIPEDLNIQQDSWPLKVKAVYSIKMWGISNPATKCSNSEYYTHVHQDCVTHTLHNVCDADSWSKFTTQSMT